MRFTLKEDNFVVHPYQDCRFTVGTKNYLLHKAKLVRSPYMKRLFEANPDVSTFDFNCYTNEKAFEAATKILYYGQLEISDDDILRQQILQYLELLELEVETEEDEEEDMSGLRLHPSLEAGTAGGVFDDNVIHNASETSDEMDFTNLSIEAPNLCSTRVALQSPSQFEARKGENSSKTRSNSRPSKIKRRELPYRSTRYSFFPIKCSFCSELGFSNELSHQRHEEICAFNENSRELFHCSEHHSEYFLEKNFTKHIDKLHSTL